MGEWKETALSEVIDLIGGGTPKTSIAEYWNGDIPWLSVADFNTGRKYVYDAEKSITQLGLKKSSTKLLQEGDIIISARGTVGVVAILGRKMAFNQSCYGVRAKEGEAQNNYVFYLLEDAVNNLQQISHGGVFDTITRDTFKEIDILLPPLPEQKAIASVLSSLDDKIDLLHCQNKTLEAMAETFFRQWFVEEAQENWDEKPLSSIAEHKKINIKPGQNIGTIYHHYSIPAFDDGKHPVKELGSEIKSNKYQVLDNSILISKLNPRFPRVWAISDLLGENSICSTEFQVVLPVKSEYYSFIYCFLKSKQVTDELIGAAGGTSGSHQRVKPEDIFNLTFQMPTQQKIDDFNLITSEYWKKITNNMKQIRTLEKLRDTLLPKLMSSTVRVQYNKEATV